MRPFRFPRILRRLFKRVKPPRPVIIIEDEPIPVEQPAPPRQKPPRPKAPEVPEYPEARPIESPPEEKPLPIPRVYPGPDTAPAPTMPTGDPLGLPHPVKSPRRVRLPGRRPKQQPKPITLPRVFGVPTLPLPILRPIPRFADPLPRVDLRPRDDVPLPNEPPQTPQSPLPEQPTTPDVLDEPLTLLTQPLLPSPDTRTRDKKCRGCRQHNRKPSNKVAKVKPYSRRMSQWSLDNLR